MRNKAKKVLTCIIVFTFLLSITTAGFAQDQFKQITAWFGDIKIVSNSQLIATDAQPFIVDGTTYVPVRMMANIFNKEVGWNGDTRTVIVNDKPNNELMALKQQLDGKNFQISQLLARIDELEEDDDDDDLIDIDDLEDDLNGDYDEYEDIEFEVFLDGDEDDVEVTIEVDLDDYDSEWDDLSDSDIEDYLQDIVDDILYEYEDADIEGEIVDIADDDEELVYFTISSSGNVQLEEDDNDLSSLEDDLNDDHSEFKNIEFEIFLDGDEDDIEVTIEVDLDDYEDEWDGLTSINKEIYIQNIVDDILDEYEDADIEGEIIDIADDDELLSFTIDSDGDVEIDD